jgi:sugar O-acyltransferase (sialic acid O-acetyltransferase NeuD family)
MKKYVMFGHNNLFGDLVEIIHANGGILTKIFQNIPEPLYPNRPTLSQRLHYLQNSTLNPAGINQFFPIQVESLDCFTPEVDEYYPMGFTGFKMDSLKKQLQSQFSLIFESLIHPTAIISPSATISEGVIVNAGSIIASGVFLGNHVAINKGVIVGHDTHLGDYVVVQPGVKIGGHVRVHQGVLLGIGSVIIEDLTIEEYSITAAGSVVIDNVPSYTLVAGVPAIVKKTINLP